MIGPDGLSERRFPGRAADLIVKLRLALAVAAVMLAVSPAGAGPAVATGSVLPAVRVTAPAVPTAPAINPYPPRIYLFRGALGPIFSTGIDRLAEKFERAGYWANVYEFTLCDLIALQVEKNYRAEPGPIVLMGHSMGGLCSVRLAATLQKEGIPVSLVVTIDPAHATKDVPPNVQRFINIFLSDNVLGGGDVKPEPGFRGHYASFDMKEHDEVTHINIEKMEALHAQLVAMVGQLAQAAAVTEAEPPVPLRLLVPPQASVELWDSGFPLSVRAGDTLEQLAATYHVPLWSIQQANPGAGNTPLIPGERIVIPRHLGTDIAAMAIAAAPAKPVQPGGKNGMIIGTRRR